MTRNVRYRSRASAPRSHWCRRSERRRRNGFTLTEVVVAAGLLVTTIATVTPLAIQGRRLLRDVRHRHLALDELSNQMEHLTTLSGPQLESAIGDLSPSPQITEAIPSARIAAETVQDELGSRLVLRLRWQRPAAAPPLELVGWLPDKAETRP